MQEQNKALPCVIKSEFILNTVDYFGKVINGFFQGLFPWHTFSCCKTRISKRYTEVLRLKFNFELFIMTVRPLQQEFITQTCGHIFETCHCVFKRAAA